jgi:hypothetical protein
MTVQPFVGPWPLFQLLDLFTQSVGHLGRGISPSQGRYLRRGQHKHRINAHTDIHASSGIQTHDASVRANEDSSCPRPRGHCDPLPIWVLQHGCRTLFVISGCRPFDYSAPPYCRIVITITDNKIPVWSMKFSLRRVSVLRAFEMWRVIGEWVPTFRRNTLPASSGWKIQQFPLKFWYQYTKLHCAMSCGLINNALSS